MDKKRILCARTELKYCTILYIIFGKAIFWVKMVFLAKHRPVYHHGSQPADQMVYNGLKGENKGMMQGYTRVYMNTIDHSINQSIDQSINQNFIRNHCIKLLLK